MQQDNQYAWGPSHWDGSDKKVYKLLNLISFKSGKKNTIMIMMHNDCFCFELNKVSKLKKLQ